MKKFTTLAITGLTALTIAASSAMTPAYAGKKERRIAAGILLGAIGGAVIASEIHRKRHKNHHYHQPDNYHTGSVYEEEYERPRKRIRRHQRSSRWERHVRRCYRRYRSYDHYSDTYIDFHGHERQCRL